jgi:hypothetical protein
MGLHEHGPKMVRPPRHHASANRRARLGHMGEGLPFLLWRISHGLRVTMKEKTFRDIFCGHFWITTSGFFSDTALVCSMMEMGIDRILCAFNEAAIYSFLGVDSGSIWRRVEPVGLRPPFCGCTVEEARSSAQNNLGHISAFGVTLTPHRP